MLRNKLLILMTLFFGLGTSSSYSQVYEPGNIVIDAYYGWPNLYTTVVRAAYESAQYSGIKIGSLGPLGGRVEYLLSENIGIGVHANYSTTSVEGLVTGYDPNTGVSRDYDYKAAVNRIRVMPMFNFHFGSSDKLDPYLAFGAGYSSFKIKVTTDDPSYDESTIDLKNPIPVAVRAEFGVRYFFSDNFGAHGFFGISGGALIGAGLSAKF